MVEPRYDWTPEAVEKLKWCIDNKLSSGAASMLLKCSRNTAIGKAIRLGLRFQSESAKNSARTIEAEKIVALKTPDPTPFTVLEPVEPPEPEIVRFQGIEVALDAVIGETGVSILDLREHHCRAIVGDDPTRYCGQPARPKSRFRYCREHAARYLTTPARLRAERQKEEA